jgi:hypothetical protein
MGKTKSVALEGVEVECTHCGVTMSSSTGGGGTIQYFRCPKCQRWVSSMYTEVFGADVKVRLRTPAEMPAASFGAVKERLEAWLKSLSPNNPYRVLGGDESESNEVLKERYRTLARKYHPDAGGDGQQMRALNEAWEAIVLERRAHAPNAIRWVPSAG